MVRTEALETAASVFRSVASVRRPGAHAPISRGHSVSDAPWARRASHHHYFLFVAAFPAAVCRAAADRAAALHSRPTAVVWLGRNVPAGRSTAASAGTAVRRLLVRSAHRRSHHAGEYRR